MGFSSDISIPAILFSLGISLLLVAMLGLFITQKMNEQNHKITSMFELVSTLANELNIVRGHLHLQQHTPSPISGGEPVENSSRMIHVSDNEDTDYPDEDSEDDDTDEDDDENDDNDNDNDNEESDNDDDSVKEESKNDEVTIELMEDTPIIEPEDLDEEDQEDQGKNVKNLDIVFDYKKASLQKLRSIVVEKGLVEDASKLKKQELFKLLELD